MDAFPEAPPGYRWIFTPTIRHKSGKILRASDYGRKAWAFLVPVEP